MQKEMLKEILEGVRSEVVRPLQTGELMTKSQLKVRKDFYAEKTHALFNKGVKLAETEIFDYPLEVAYLLCCYPIQLIAVIDAPNKLCEYWEFYLENFPGLKFSNNLEEFYHFLKRCDYDAMKI